MKKLAIMLVAAVFTASLVACGCTDRNATNNGTTNSTTQQSGTGTTPVLPNRPGTNNGTGNNNTGANNNTGSNMNGNTGNNTIGDDLENAVDDMGNAVDDLLGGDNHNAGNNAGSNGTNNAGNNSANNGTNAGINNGAAGNNAARSRIDPTGFQQMISNARVHDTDGILTDGENNQS